jgi:hypothetical protein
MKECHQLFRHACARKTAFNEFSIEHVTRNVARHDKDFSASMQQKQFANHVNTQCIERDQRGKT